MSENPPGGGHGDGHIFRRFDSEMAHLHALVVRMAELAVAQLRAAVATLKSRDVAAARRVIANDKKLNDLDVEADDEIVRIIALRQPMAGDLREIIALSKIVAELERAGDEARKIAGLTVKFYADSSADSAAGDGEVSGDGSRGGDGDIHPRHPRNPNPRHPRSLLSGGGDGEVPGDGGIHPRHPRSPLSGGGDGGIGDGESHGGAGADENAPADAILRDIHALAAQVEGMLRAVTAAFDAPDLDLARALEVLGDDLKLDESLKVILRRLTDLLIAEPRHAAHFVDIVLGIRALERFGGHAKNIAGHLVFIKHGIDVRHEGVASILRQLREQNPGTSAD